jgi:hypothetical protein
MFANEELPPAFVAVPPAPTVAVTEDPAVGIFMV